MARDPDAKRFTTTIDRATFDRIELALNKDPRVKVTVQDKVREFLIELDDQLNTRRRKAGAA